MDQPASWEDTPRAAAVLRERATTSHTTRDHHAGMEQRKGYGMNLTVSETAQKQLTTLVTERAEGEQGLRLFARAGGGGCACSGPGVSFGMGLDTAAEGDTVLEIGTLKFILDENSAVALEDASIDYVEDVMQQGFSIEAPNAAKLAGAAPAGGGCACGGH